MRAAADPEREIAAREAILPSHAWMVGVAVDEDGSLIPPPEVTSRSDVLVGTRATDGPEGAAFDGIDDPDAPDVLI